jgi:hypothetical protein
MRYLRMFTNAMVGGVLGALYVAVLVLQLNPHVPTISTTARDWFVVLLAFYGLYLTVAIYLIMLTREVFARRALSPGWLSVGVLAWVGTGCAGAAAALTWGNLDSFGAVLADQGESMRQGAVALTVAASVIAAVAVLRYSFGRKGSRAAGSVLVLALVSSFAVPLWFRGPGELRVPVAGSALPAPPRPAPVPVPALPGVPAPEVVPRVHVILLDGASRGFLLQRIAAGRLPNFGRLFGRGAVLDLATIKPTQAEPVWATVATGKYPPRNGVRSNAVYRVRPDDQDPVDLLPDHCFAYGLVDQRFVTEDFLTSSALRARPIWDILADPTGRGDQGLATGVVNWPLTFPADARRGYIISERFDEATRSPLRSIDAHAANPTSAVDATRQVFDAWNARPWHEVLPSFPATEPRPEGLETARWDSAYSAAARLLNRVCRDVSRSATSSDQEGRGCAFSPRFTAVRYEGLDQFGHVYLRDAQPELFGESSSRRVSLSVLDRYYAFIDDEVGRVAAGLEPGDLLLVVSGFGMTEESLMKRWLARRLGWLLRLRDWTGTHEYAPDGFLLAYGSNVARADLPRGALVDVAPTILYYIGLPVGRDMDGQPRTDIFLRTFTIEHPVGSIETHERPR